MCYLCYHEEVVSKDLDDKKEPLKLKKYNYMLLEVAGV